MHGIVDVTAFHRVEMNVLELLSQHRLVLNYLWVAAFLPELVLTVSLMSCLLMPQLIEQRLLFVFLKKIDYLPRGEGLEVSDFLS